MGVYAVFFVLLGFTAAGDGISAIILVAQRLRHCLQGDGQHLIDPLDSADGQMRLDIIRDFLEIAFILFRYDHRLDAAAARRQ